jgi:hypothetical protein
MKNVDENYVVVEERRLNGRGTNGLLKKILCR